MIVSNEAEKGVEWIFLIVVKQYVTACCRESVPDTGFASVPDRVSGNAGAWEFVPPVPKEMSNLMPEQIFRISYLGFPIVSLPFYLDTSPRQNTNKICFCTRLIRIFVIRRTGVDPFGDILTIRGRSVALSVTHFGKFTIYNDSYGRTAHRARVYRDAFRRCGNRRKAGVEHGLFYR